MTMLTDFLMWLMQYDECHLFLYDHEWTGRSCIYLPSFAGHHLDSNWQLNVSGHIRQDPKEYNGFLHLHFCISHWLTIYFQTSDWHSWVWFLPTSITFIFCQYFLTSIFFFLLSVSFYQCNGLHCKKCIILCAHDKCIHSPWCQKH